MASLSEKMPAVTYSNMNYTMDHFEEVSFLDYKPNKRPPFEYLCHICFQTNHYIRDCPQVSGLHVKVLFLFSPIAVNLCMYIVNGQYQYSSY